jgi:hypothetical protein
MINTDKFNFNQTLYLKNVKFYGDESATALVRINIHVGGC